MERTHFIFFVLFTSVGISLHSLAANKQLIGARYPALSPDGRTIAFSYMGDLWLVSSEGGKATRLTDHVAYDREPVWSEDGQSIAFSSNRNGNYDVYLVSVQGGTPKQLTFHTGDDIATDFSPDNQWILFRSNRSSMSSMFKISVHGGNPIPVLDTYWSWPFQGKFSLDGSSVLLSLGMENDYWWRRGYRGSNSTQIWSMKLGEKRAEFVFSDSSNTFWPDWSIDGQRIYFVSDRKFGASNIWTAAKDGTDFYPITRFSEYDVRWLSVASHVPLAVYERNFGLWITALTSGESRLVPIEAPAETKENRIFFIENDSVSEFRLSPDGKKIAAVVHGDIFVLSQEGGYARNITNTPWRERDIDWDKESRNLVYVSDTDANPDIYIISALGDEKPKRLTLSEEDELSPRFSPDGKWIAYFRGKRQIRLVLPDGQKDQLLAEGDFGGRFGGTFSWAPDSRNLAVVVLNNANSDIFAINIQSKEKVWMTNTAYNETNPFWSFDGKRVLFTSNRFGHSFPEFTGKWDIYQVYLEPRKPEFDEDTFEKLFALDKEEKKEEKEKSKKIEGEKQAPMIHLNLEDLDLQTEQVTNTLGDDREYVLSPKDTSTVYFVSNVDGEDHLWKINSKKKEKAKVEPFMPQITNPQNLQLDAKGQKLYYISKGKIGCVDIGSSKNESVSFSTKIQVDKTADYEQMLAELYYTLQHYYYDEKFHEVNWKRVYEQFRPVLQQVREDQDFYDYANEMIGYLNSSHTGMRPPRDAKVEKPSAHLGGIWKFQDDAVILDAVLKNGPFYFYHDRVASGDGLFAIDGDTVRSDKNIWQCLNGKIGKRVKITIKSRRFGKNITLSVKPISAREENQLVLESWIESRRELVKKKTNDQVAYMYMRAMGREDLERFLKELQRDAVPRKALILDLRYNFGGNVHDRVLEALTKPVYAKWRRRDLSETQQSTFGFADKPVVLLTNEVTLSDGEMTANGFKALKRGTVVGNTTYGWLIFTSSVRLMNGGSFRLPFLGCYTLDGKDLETMGGVKPDIFVVNDVNDDLLGQDPQLEKAVQVVLEKIQ